MKGFLLFLLLLIFTHFSLAQSNPYLSDEIGYFSKEDSLLIERKLAELDSVIDFRIVILEDVLSPINTTVAFNMHKDRGPLGDTNKPDVFLVFDFKAKRHDLYVTSELLVYTFDYKVRDSMSLWGDETHIAKEILDLTEALVQDYSITREVYKPHSNPLSEEEINVNNVLRNFVSVLIVIAVFVVVFFMIKYFGGEDDEDQEQHLNNY